MWVIFIIKNFIFDFGQVLVSFEPWYMTKAFLNDENDCRLVCDIVFDRLYWDRLDMGSITDEEVKTGFCSRLPLRLHKAACEIYDNWIYNIPLIDGMKSLVEELKEKGKKVFLLSNISVGFSQRYKLNKEVNELLSLFDGLVFSGPIGKIKPTKDIYNHILQEYSLNANETIFIDDNEKNIIGAENCGIKGYLFDGNADKLKSYIVSKLY